MSRPAQLDTAELPLLDDPYGTSPAVQRRRRHAALARRRRLLLADIAAGVAVGVLALIIAPGLAIAALGAIVVLVGCGLAAAGRLVRRRRAARSHARPSAPRVRRVR